MVLCGISANDGKLLVLVIDEILVNPDMGCKILSSNAKNRSMGYAW